MSKNQQSAPEQSETSDDHDIARCDASGLAKIVMAHEASLTDVNNFDTDLIDPLEGSSS